MNMLQQLSWQHPWAFIFLLLPVLIYSVSFLLHYKSLRAYADMALLAWIIPNKAAWNLHRFKIIGYIAAWVCLSIALAGPKVAVQNEKDYNLDIVLLVDTSRSMLANDVFPSRLQRAKLELYELLNSPAKARFSIVVFAARAHLYVPPTNDRKLLRYYIERLDSLILPTRGSEFTNAVDFANQYFKHPSRPTVYFLLSDGEFQGPINVNTATPPIFVLGIGSVSGSGIPVEEGQWLEHDSRQVITRLNENELRRIATQSRGAYRRASNNDNDWQFLLKKMEASITASTPPRSEQNEWKYLYQIPLFTSMLLLFVSLTPGRQGAQKSLLLLLAIGLNAHTQPAHAASATSAYQALTSKQYQKAIDIYQSIGGFNGHIGSGVAYYLSNNMYAAEKEFQQAVLSAGNDDLRAKAIFNLANTHFRLGDYEMAMQLYQNSLLYKPDFPAAKNNLKLSQTIWDLILKNLEQIDLNADVTAGSGPRERVSNDENIQNFNASLSIAKEDKTKFSLPSLPDVKKLIQQGIDKFRIAAQGINDSDEIHRQHKVNAAKLAIKRLQNKDPFLWKSLFEIEEGFPAPQEKPVVIPGISPW